MNAIAKTLSALFLLAPFSTSSPQGATAEDRSAVQGFGAFQPGVATDTLPSAIDFRPYLPEVGSQTMNDCAAWAFGYAGRSYLEAIDQGWKPDSEERIFSPTFIYNLVNGGVDQGSRVDKVLELLMNSGAATLSTAPYLPGDYLTQPPAAAGEEARVFRIADFRLLPSGEAIKGALAEGHIVLCCVRTNPIFSSGYSRPYTAEQHRQGQAARRPGQPHGFHAMAIVGYSDARQAFLFMNSWGKAWGESGFLWVSYEVLEHFNTEQDTEQLMDFAVVMLDRNEPVVREQEHYKVVALESLEPSLFAAYAGWDPRSERDSWRYTISLRGEAGVLGFVKEVRWTVPGLEGEQTITSEKAGSAFRITGRSPSAEVRVQGVAILNNGKEMPLAAATTVPENLRRVIGVQRIDAFHRKYSTGTEHWRWTLVPQMSDADWASLESIRWELESELAAGEKGEVDLVYEHKGGLAPKWSPDASFAPSYISAKPISGVAHFRFRDGGVLVQEFGAEPFSSEVLESGVLEYVTRPEGQDGSRGWHFVELRARYPEYWKDEILGTRFQFGTSASGHQGQGRQVGGPEPYMHVMSSYVDGPFRPSGMIFFRDRSLGFGSSTPAMNYVEVDLGPGTAWPVPWPAGQEPQGANSGVGLNYRDRYIGQRAGQASWAIDVYLDGNTNLGYVKSIEWEFGEAASPDPEAQAQIAPRKRYRRRQLISSAPFLATAHCTDVKGFTFDLELLIEPRSSANTGLAVDLTSVPVPELEAATPGRVLAEVNLLGLPADLNGLRSLRCWSKRSWGGVIPVQAKWWRYNEVPRADFARLELPLEEPTLFLLEYDDGSAVAVHAQPHARAPVKTAPRLQILARERFIGWRAGLPVWQVDASLRGQAGLLDAVQQIQWKVHIGGMVKLDLGEQGSATEIHFTTSEPASLSASLTFDPDAGLADQKVESLVTTLSPRSSGELTLRTERGWRLPTLQEAGPKEELYGEFWEPTPFRLRVMGPPDRLRDLTEVRYSVQALWRLEVAERDGTPAPEPEVSVVQQVPGTATHCGFEVICDLDDRWVVTTTLVFTDGSTRSFEPQVVGGPSRSVEWDPRRTHYQKQVREWGMVEGRRAVLLSVALLPGMQTKHLMRAELGFDKPPIPAGGSPAASFDSGHSLREFLVFEDTHVERVEIIRMDPWGVGFEEENVQLDWAPIGVSLTESKPRIHVLPRFEEQRLNFVSIDVPASYLGQIRSVVYDVLQSGKRKIYKPIGPFGEHSTNFEVRIPGPAPTSISARLFGVNGRPPVAEIR